MNVNAVNSSGVQSSPVKAAAAEDALSKSIKEQIMRAQKQLQALAQDKEMPMEQKMEKRKEIQQQINDLNNQLRQHQLEVRKEKQQEKAEAAKPKQSDEQAAAKAGEQTTRAMLAADSSLKQAKIQDNVATEATNKANILKSELKMTKGDKVIAAKQQEIAELEQTAQNAENAQAQSLGEANKAIEELKNNHGAESSSEVASDARTDEDAKGTEDAKNGKNAKGEEDGNDVSVQSEENIAIEKLTEKSMPKMYTSDGKPVEEESEATVSVRV